MLFCYCHDLIHFHRSKKALPLHRAIPVMSMDHIHLFTPFPGGMKWFSPFPLTRRTKGRQLPAKCLLFENFSKNFFGNSRAAKDDKNRPVGLRPTGRENALLCC